MSNIQTNDSLSHHGVLGMKWGVRKEQKRAARAERLQKFAKSKTMSEAMKYTSFGERFIAALPGTILGTTMGQVLTYKLDIDPKIGQFITGALGGVLGTTSMYGLTRAAHKRANQKP